jgi:hypothetical protein
VTKSRILAASLSATTDRCTHCHESWHVYCAAFALTVVQRIAATVLAGNRIGSELGHEQRANPSRMHISSPPPGFDTDRAAIDALRSERWGTMACVRNDGKREKG